MSGKYRIRKHKRRKHRERESVFNKLEKECDEIFIKQCQREIDDAEKMFHQEKNIIKKLDLICFIRDKQNTIISIKCAKYM